MKAKRYHVTTILIVLGLLFAATCACWATLSSVSGDKLVVTGTEVGANVTITMTAGSADVDISSATIPRNYKGHKLQIKDPYGKSAYGYVYTDGAGTVQNIVSAKGGTTRNWSAIETGFNATATGTFPYRIYKDSRLVQVATGSVTQANTRLDMTSDNAFAWLNGVDLSAYQTGKYYLCLYNATGGYGACGWISSEAPAGETLDTNVFDTFDFTSGWSIVGGDTAIIDANSFSTGTASRGIYKSAASSNAGSLYTVSGVGTANCYIGFYNSGTSVLNLALGGSAIYRNSPVNDNLYLRNQATGTTDVTSINLQNILDPPSTAVKIVSSDGSTRAWPWKHASFNPNDASGITYKVYYAGD